MTGNIPHIPSGLAYFIGGGIASLAGAVFLIRDGAMPGSAIHIFEESMQPGGSLDAHGNPETGYILRGGRMLDETAHTSLFDLLGAIPGINNNNESLKDDIVAFNQQHRYSSHCRLVAQGKPLDNPAFGLSWLDRFDLLRLSLTPEWMIGRRRIQDFFRPAFFKTNFWAMWCTIFAFQPWHSAIECKRYMLRLIQWVDTLGTLAGVVRTPLNQHESLTLPIYRWLQEKGVQFHTGTQVTHLGFTNTTKGQRVHQIHIMANGTRHIIELPLASFVFATLGSMTASTTVGSMVSPPSTCFQPSGGSWALWETLATGRPEFGSPVVFNGNTALSRWVSFTLTLRSPLFPQMVERFTGNKTGTGGLVTFKDSGWLLSVVMLRNPQFSDQPKSVDVGWGYGLCPDRPGDYIRKPMALCTGEEILAELCHQFGLGDRFQEIASTSTCIPCEMPLITSQFMPRRAADRPNVIPDGYTNLAIIGQFCEIPDDTVFTVEYSVRSAQIAVYEQLKLKRKVPPIYKGQYDPRVVCRAIRALLR